MWNENHHYTGRVCALSVRGFKYAQFRYNDDQTITILAFNAFAGERSPKMTPGATFVRANSIAFIRGA